MDILEERALLSGATATDPTVIVQTTTGSTTGSTTNLTQNQAYVTGLYAVLLGRSPDQAGLNAYVNQLNSGSSPRSVASQIVNSQEYGTDVVQSLYRGFLGRPADQAGLNSYLNELAHGGNIRDVEAQILGSNEFYSRVGNTNQGYVNALYAILLGRSPDSGSQAYLTQLNNGTSRQDVASSILHSKEFETNEVTSFYGQFLGRAPDQAGLNSYVHLLSHGGNEQDVILDMVSSQEFMNDTNRFFNVNGTTGTTTGGTTGTSTTGTTTNSAQQANNQAFVTALYNRLLGRAPDSQGLQSYTNALNSGLMTRHQVVQSFLGSNEFQTNLVTQLYRGFLGRNPDQAGLSFYTNELAGGSSLQTVASQILGSNEFFNRVGNTNQGYINGLYAVVLGRAPDTAGSQFYLNELNNGTSRQDVANSILTSQESVNNVVTGLYGQLLSRAPDSGSQGFVNGLTSGQMNLSDVIVAMTTSPEFVSNAALNPNGLIPLIPITNA